MTQISAPRDETQETPAVTTSAERRAHHRAHAARHLYESQWIPGMPPYHELSRASLRRCENAADIGAKSLDMTKILREAR